MGEDINYNYNQPSRWEVISDIKKTLFTMFRRFLNNTFRNLFFVAVFLCAIPAGFAQVNLIDSIRVGLQKKPTPIFDFSSRYSFINGLNSPIVKIKFGLNFGKKFTTGIAYAYLKRPYRIDNYVINNANLGAAFLHIRYVNFFADVVFYRTSHWEFTIPIQVGIGRSFVDYVYQAQYVKERKKLILLYEPSISGSYKIIPWFGVGMDIGYRFMFVNNKNIDRKFNSPVYGFMGIIYFSEIYRLYIKKRLKHEPRILKGF